MPSVAVPAADTSILLVVPVAVIAAAAAVVAASSIPAAAAVAASSTPAAVLPTQPAMAINKFVILGMTSTHLHSLLQVLGLLLM